MAKRRVRPSAKRPKTGQPEKRLVVRDERLLSPVLADSATLSIGKDVAIHSLYQTEIPVGGLPTGALESVLVGRYAYPNEHFKAAVALFIRQYVALETFRERKEEATAWLHQLLDELS